MGLFHRAAGLWRRSLQLRAVVLTMLVTIVIVGVAGTVLVSRIESGLVEARIRSAKVEVSAGASIARSAAQGSAQDETATDVIDGLVAELATRAGEPPAYEVVLLPKPDSGNPVGLTSLIDPEAVPEALRGELANGSGPIWMLAPIEYSDGRVSSGLIVGAPVTIRGIGKYEIFYLYSLEGVHRTVSLITSAITGIGVILVFTLGLLAWFSTRRLVLPVQQAAETADALAAGDLDRRLPVRGEDDLAVLAKAFNTMADSLSDQIVRLERLSDTQRRFVSDVSHELRTPLTTIRMAAEVADERAATQEPDVARASQLLLSEVDRFESLLADLLEVSRFDAEAVSLEAEDVELSALVADTVAQLEAVAADRDTPLRVHIPDGGCLISGDARRIQRIVRNLVVNAIEYGAGEPVEVYLICTQRTAEVRVRDHGVGIAPENRDKVFERFWRADSSRARTLGGTGLGLAISWEDARLHGGSLRVYPASPGSEFVLRLPQVD